MKIRLAYTIEVDADAWAEAYGCAREDVREDVNIYFRNQISQSPAAEETGLEIIN